MRQHDQSDAWLQGVMHDASPHAMRANTASTPLKAFGAQLAVTQRHRAPSVVGSRRCRCWRTFLALASASSSGLKSRQRAFRGAPAALFVAALLVLTLASTTHTSKVIANGCAAPSIGWCGRIGMVSSP